MNKILSLDCYLSTCKFEKAAPVTIEMFDQVKLTTLHKSVVTSPVSSLHLCHHFTLQEVY